MRKGNPIRPKRELIKRGLVDMIRRVEANHGGQKCPGAEGARAESCYVGGLFERRVGGRRVVDARGVGQRAVGLDAV